MRPNKLPARRSPSLATALLAMTLVAVAAPAQAAAEKGATEGQHVDLTGIPFPIVVNGRLVNYVFVVLRLTAQSGADATRIKAREPYMRDYLVRLGHKQPFVKAGDISHVDDRRLLAAAAAESARLIGPRMVKTVGIASQTPQRRSGLLGPPLAPPIAH